jgi:hypothetical protein
VPRHRQDDDPELGSWVWVQRSSKSDGSLFFACNRAERLDAIGFLASYDQDLAAVHAQLLTAKLDMLATLCPLVSLSPLMHLYKPKWLLTVQLGNRTFLRSQKSCVRAWYHSSQKEALVSMSEGSAWSWVSLLTNISTPSYFLKIIAMFRLLT